MKELILVRCKMGATSWSCINNYLIIYNEIINCNVFVLDRSITCLLLETVSTSQSSNYVHKK